MIISWTTHKFWEHDITCWPRRCVTHCKQSEVVCHCGNGLFNTYYWEKACETEQLQGKGITLWHEIDKQRSTDESSHDVRTAYDPGSPFFSRYTWSCSQRVDTAEHQGINETLPMWGFTSLKWILSVLKSWNVVHREFSRNLWTHLTRIKNSNLTPLGVYFQRRSLSRSSTNITHRDYRAIKDTMSAEQIKVWEYNKKYTAKSIVLLLAVIIVGLVSVICTTIS